MRRIAAKLSLFMGSGNLVIAGHEWLWVVVAE